MELLRIPKRERNRYEYIWCRKCNRTVNTRCGLTQKRRYTCAYLDRHRYRAIVYVPGSGNKRISRNFETRDYKEFQVQARQFVEQLEELNYKYSRELRLLDTQENKERKKPIDDPQSLPISYKCVVDHFLDFMSDKGVKEHKRKNYSKQYIKELRLFFKHFAVAMEKLVDDPAKMPIMDIGEREVERFHQYLEADQEDGTPRFSPTTYNKAMGFMRKLYRHINDRLLYNIPDPFQDVREKPVRKNRAIIELHEFDAVLQVVTPENGKYLKKDRGRFYWNTYYYPWMRNAFRLMLETGERRDGVAYMKWTDVDMKAGVISIRNHKVSNTQKQEVIREIPITRSLSRLLHSMGYPEKVRLDEYIIAEEIKTRKTVMNYLSKAFTHFWKLTGIQKEVTLKHLRKTYVTLMFALFDRDTPNVTGQSLDNIMENYLHKRKIIQKARNTSLDELDALTKVKE